MPFISQDQNKNISIENFIFHVVHHGGDDPILLDETPLGSFHDFFVGRVREVLKGNRFEFNNGSSAEELIRHVDRDTSRFVEVSKRLAVEFHSHGDDRVKPGVLIFMKVKANKELLYSLIKYDHQQALTYSVGDDHKAILKEIENTLTKSTKSLHKSALIRLKEQDGGEILVVDRKVNYDISKFFKGFLNVKRKYSRAQLTTEIQDITIQTTLDLKENLPNSFTSNIKKNSYNCITSLDEFSTESYLQSVFGSHLNDNIRSRFSEYLADREIDGETFKFDNTGLEEPGKRKLRTREGIKIEYTEDKAKDNIEITDFGDDNEKKKITITTSKLWEE